MLRKWDFKLELSKNKNNHLPLYRQIAQQIESLIISGILKPGDPLPGSRILAGQLGVSRKSVMKAIEILTLSGWILNKERSGAFVAPHNKDYVTKFLPQQNKSGETHSQIMIDDGTPDTHIAPMNELARAYRRVLNLKGRYNILGYNDPEGDYKFRTTISSMLNQERGLMTQPEEIIITRGSQMAIFMVAHAVLKPGDTVIMEYPCYDRAYKAFSKAGQKIIFIDVDDEGIKTQDISSILAEEPKAIYLTPRHQYPTMAELSNYRRYQLAEWAITQNLLIIEDDYDCDFSFQDNPVMPLSALVAPGQYIYIGTFSKIIAPAIRIGFIATTKHHIDALRNLREIIDIQGDIVMETAILDLIEDGELTRHIKKSTEYYRQKRQLFIGLLHQHLNGLIDFSVPQGGLAIWIRLLESLNFKKLVEIMKREHIEIPVFTDSRGKIGMRFGYASVSERDMETVIKKLGSIIKQCQQTQDNNTNL
ncbi:MAG: PLP-dependent aminotransferase family protein [Bacteroides sp.]|nr:PLP-dependent aminotransferase family protein [Bacteroides sp.]